MKGIAKNCLSLLLIVLSVALLIKEQALFMTGSMLFAMLFLAAAYACGLRAKQEKTDRFRRILLWAETVLSLLYGVSFLLISENRLFAYTLSIGITMILDGVVRLIRRWLIK